MPIFEACSIDFFYSSLSLVVFTGICAQSRWERKLRSVATEAFFELNSEEGYFELKSDVPSKNNVRLTAIALNVTLGVFGMHRLYLGTDVKVPVFTPSQLVVDWFCGLPFRMPYLYEGHQCLLR